MLWVLTLLGNKKQMTLSKNQPFLCTVRFQYARKKTKHGENKRFQASRWENNMKLERVYHQKWKINDSKPMDGKGSGGSKIQLPYNFQISKWHQDIWHLNTPLTQRGVIHETVLNFSLKQPRGSKFNRMLKNVWCGFPGPNAEGKPLQLYDFH